MRSSFKPRFLLQHGGSTPIGRLSWSGYHRAEPIGRNEPLQTHDSSYAVIYLLEGAGHYRDESGADRKVMSGDLIFTFPGFAKRYGPFAGQDWVEFYITFDGPVFDLWRESGLLDPAKPVRHLEPLDYWIRRFEDVVTRHGPGDQYALERVSQFQDLLAELIRFLDQRDVRGEEHDWLGQAYGLLDSIDPCQGADYSALAERQGMSYEGFRKRFTRLAGVTPGQYLAKAQIRRVCNLLENSSAKLHQIAEQCGFSDEFHLSKRFKQLTGVTPREFRQWAHATRAPG